MLKIGTALPSFSQSLAHSCINQHVYEIASTPGENFDDLQFLKPLVADKKIVLLGESAHTIGDYYILKTRLIQYLHEECGFDVIATENGIADVYGIFIQADTISALQLRNKSLYANQRCNEVLPLYEYIKNVENNTINYCGFDSQNHGSSLDVLKSLLHQYYGDKSDSLVNNLLKYYQIPQLTWQENKASLFKLSDTIIQSANQLLNLLQEQKNQLISNNQISITHYTFLERALHNHIESVNFDWNTTNPLERRDSLMAANLVWLSEEIYPGKKIVVWGHNTHIDKGGTEALNKSMGYYVNQQLPESTYHIGLYAKTGELYWWWDKQTRSYNNTQDNDIETIADVFPITFLDITGSQGNCEILHSTVMGFEAEFGREIPFIPADRYDAIINFRTAKACTY